MNYSFHGVFTRVDGAVLEELREIITKKGFPSFKAYTTYAYPMEDRDLLQILHVIRETGGLLCVHAENDAITNLLKERFAAEGGLSPIHQALSRPAAAEAETVARLLRLAEIEDEARLYIVHLSAGESMDAVAAAREKGQKNIFVETCTQYLMLTEDKFREGGDEEGIKYILAPPFRKQKDIDRLWRGLANEEIQVVATDHFQA